MGEGRQQRDVGIVAHSYNHRNIDFEGCINQLAKASGITKSHTKATQVFDIVWIIEMRDRLGGIEPRIRLLFTLLPANLSEVPAVGGQ
ncbi:hypothetical protein CSTAT_10540 [Corynebacterium stationis]|nr:hypothetical protein CSTAT_10540 [Corynebacterium stationis]